MERYLWIHEEPPLDLGRWSRHVGHESQPIVASTFNTKLKYIYIYISYLVSLPQ